MSNASADYAHCLFCQWQSGENEKAGILSCRRKNWYCWFLLFRAYFTVTNGLVARCSAFPTPLLFSLSTSWMRHPLQGERNVPATSLASRQDTEPCSQFTTNSPPKCATASRPLAWG